MSLQVYVLSLCACAYILSSNVTALPYLSRCRNTETMQTQLDAERPTGSSPIQNYAREAKMQDLGGFKILSTNRKNLYTSVPLGKDFRFIQSRLLQNYILEIIIEINEKSTPTFSFFIYFFIGGKLIYTIKDSLHQVILSAVSKKNDSWNPKLWSKVLFSQL